MAIGGASDTGKRPLYDADDDNGDTLFVSQAARKKVKSEVPEDDSNSFNEDADGGGDAEASDDDDDDDDDDDNEDDGLYSEKQEAFPSHPAFDKRIPKVKKMLAELAEDALASVNRTTCDTDEVNELRSRAQKASIIPEHLKPMIGLIGNAGEGKSSLVNSLCDCPDLAKALDAGESCTFVITKYMSASESQQLRFSFTVEFYDSSTIAKILCAALDDWHAFYHEPDPTWKQADKEYHESRATTCLSMFRAIFCGHPEFRADESATAELHLASSRRGFSRTQLIDALVQRVERVLEPRKREDGVYAHYDEADSTEELWKLLDPFITEGENPDEPSPWCLVKQVTIGVKGSRVLDAYVLVDMPGVSDTNQVRVDATQQFLKQCDHLVVVARAGRVMTDPVVSSMVQKYAQAFGGNVMVVATKSDENVNDKVATEMVKSGYSIGNYNALKASTDLMNSEIKALERKKKKSAKSSSKQPDLESQISELQQRKQANENVRWELVVRARNARNSDRLRQDRQGHLPAGKKLHVFGVSNRHYEKLRTDDVSGEYILSPEGTGIPALRQHLLRLVAPLIWRTLKGFVDSQPGVLVPGFEMWAGNGTLVKNRTALLKVVAKQEHEFDPEFESYQESLGVLVDKEIVSALRENQPRFSSSNVSYVRQTLSKYQWNTLKAFCLRDGSHKTSVLSESWNDHFTTESTEMIEKSWEAFTSSRKGLSGRMKEKIVEAIQAIPEILRGQAESTGLPLDKFEQALKGHVSGITLNFKRHDEAFDKGLRTIYLNSTLEGSDNYFKEGMKDVYETCSEDAGHGVKARALEALATHLGRTGDTSPFAVMSASIERDIDAAATEQVGGVSDDLEVVFKDILRDVQSMIGKKSTHPSEHWVREAVKKFVETGSLKLDDINSLMRTIEIRHSSESED